MLGVEVERLWRLPRWNDEPDADEQQGHSDREERETAIGAIAIAVGLGVGVAVIAGSLPGSAWPLAAYEV
ncbi:hypothetical protein AB0K52_15290 [Glycomyces sp. NPDC049804]|uniref:hypothetical protein n=1 Tax=Glycomyces sp. NPDC049804 TaxID=3154363 RepID=UPI00342F6335